MSWRLERPHSPQFCKCCFPRVTVTNDVPCKATGSGTDHEHWVAALDGCPNCGARI